MSTVARLFAVDGEELSYPPLDQICLQATASIGKWRRGIADILNDVAPFISRW